MQFTNPIWLWGLSGLLIPIGIHLLSRKEGKIFRIGSVRHLEDTISKQFKSIRLNEFVLLGLRCLLITILVLFFAEPNLNLNGKNGKWLLIERGLENDQEFSSLIDSLEKNGYQSKALAEGFPDLENSSERKKADYWSLIDEFKTKSVEQAIVLSYNYLEGFKGKRPSLPADIQWISKVPDPTTFALHAVRTSKDSIMLREGHSDAVKTIFSNVEVKVPSDKNIFVSDNSDSVQIEFPDTVSIAIVSDLSFARDATILAAVLKAIDKKSSNVFLIEKSSTETYSAKKNDWIIWLSEHLPSQTENQNIIYYRHRDSNKILVQTENTKWVLTKRLNEEIALQENITVRLALIFDRQNEGAVKASQFDRRVLSERKIWAVDASAGDRVHAGVSNTTPKYLIVFFLLVLVIERWIAFKRNQ